jgi:cellobiose-specific phosphotransferase system component IIB
MAFTKGEWRLENEKELRGSTVIVADDKEKEEVKVIADTAVNAYPRISTDEKIDNASLMAASPQLLHLLKVITEDVDEGCDIETDRVLEAHIDEAKQLIKKLNEE